MWKALRSFLNRPGFRGKLIHNPSRTSFYIFVLVFYLLILLEPFSLNLLPVEARLIMVAGCAGCAIIAFSIVITVFSPFRQKRWTILNSFYMYMSCLLLSWLLIYGYILLCFHVLFIVFLNLDLAVKIREFFFIRTLLYTFTIGSIVFCILHMYNLMITKKLHGKSQVPDNRSDLKETPSTRDSFDSTILLHGKNLNEHITIKNDGILYMQSEGHFIRIYYICHTSQQVKTHIVRNTMNAMEEQTVAYPHIYRCHRSYFINLNYLKSVTGNSSKSFARLTHMNQKIPISKGKIHYLKSIAHPDI